LRKLTIKIESQVVFAKLPRVGNLTLTERGVQKFSWEGRGGKLFNKGGEKRQENAPNSTCKQTPHSRLSNKTKSSQTMKEE